MEQTPRAAIATVAGWTLGKTLGRGAYAHVRLATHPNGHQAACKILPALHRPRTSLITWDEVVDAIEAHKEVVLLKAMWGAGLKGVVGLEGVIEEGGWTYVFLALYKFSASSVSTPWNHNLLVPFFRKLLLTVHALHSLEISHEDLKRSNILLDKLYQPVVVDFGFSHFKPGGGFVHSAGGTLDYSSPEKVLDRAYDPKANDVWALGILLSKLLGLDHPFCSGDGDDESLDVKVRIVKADLGFRWQIEDLQAGGLADLLHGMLNKDPVRRLTIPQILLHPYLFTQLPDARRYKPPSFDLPNYVPSPIPASIVEDIAFLSYLDKSFCLCESMKKVKERILGNEPCWEKRWAGMLCRWRKREELNWEDVIKVEAGSKAHKPRKTHNPQPLREIHLSPNIATTHNMANIGREPAKVPPAGNRQQNIPSRRSLIKQMQGKNPLVPRSSSDVAFIKREDGSNSKGIMVMKKTQTTVTHSPIRGHVQPMTYIRRRISGVKSKIPVIKQNDNDLGALEHDLLRSFESPTYTSTGLASRSPSTPVPLPVSEVTNAKGTIAPTSKQSLEDCGATKGPFLAYVLTSKPRLTTCMSDPTIKAKKKRNTAEQKENRPPTVPSNVVRRSNRLQMKATTK